MDLRAIPRWRPSDPGHFALRLAVRTGVVMPIALALGLLGGEQAALFASFGTVSMLVFVDFGGPRPVRLLAYLALAVASSGLIVLGTLCSRKPVVGALVMLVVGFAILFSGVLNGYFAAAASAALLTFILPAMVPAGADDIGARLAGWWIAVALSVPATFLLLPARPRDRLRAAVAEVCRVLAATPRDPSPEAGRALVAAVQRMHDRFAATPYRPTGPTGETGALAAMIDELDWLGGLALHPAARGAVLAPTPGEVALRAINAEALLASAALAEGRTTELPDRAALQRGRERVLTELLAQIDDPAVRGDDDRLGSALRRAWDVRVASYLTLDMAERAAPEDDAGHPLRYLRRQRVALAASGRVVAAHAGVGSIWFRNSVRGAVGLALALLVAGELSVQHAFWVVLGALSVLRSSALNTGASIVQALAGTLVGIVAGGLLIVALGGNRTALWIALPFASMLAAYAPRAVSFAAGQAGFTVVVFVIFNLLEPAGWEVGLIRLEDVAIGFAISFGVGLLFWPRGAAALLRTSLAHALAASARDAADGFRRLAGGAPAAEDPAPAAAAAAGRLDIAFRQRLAERSSQELRLPSASWLVGVSARLRGTGDAMRELARRVGATTRPDGAHAMEEEARRVAAWYAALGDRLSAHRPPPDDEPLTPGLRGELLEAVRAGHATGSPDRLFAGVALAWGGLHVDDLRRLQPRSAAAAADLADGGSPAEVESKVERPTSHA